MLDLVFNAHCSSILFSLSEILLELEKPCDDGKDEKGNAGLASVGKSLMYDVIRIISLKFVPNS